MTIRFCGLIGFFIGISLLSLELILLKSIQILEKISGSWYSNIIDYIKEPTILLSFVLTGCIIISSVIVIFYGYKCK